jgi:broad specificity phosphatase PhoE
MPTTPVVVVLPGPSSEQSSRIASALRDRLTPATRVNPDMLRDLVSSVSLGETWVSVATNVAAHLVIDLVNGGISAVVDGIFTDERTLDEACELFRRANVTYHIFATPAAITDIDGGGPGGAADRETAQRATEEIAEDLLQRIRREAAPSVAGGSVCIFMRHGSCSYESSRYQAPRDVGLTKAGAAAVRATAKTLIGFRPDRIVVSPYRRAIETAEILYAIVGTEWKVVDGLRERHFTSIEGRTYDQLRLSGDVDVDTLLTCSERMNLPGEETIEEAQTRITTTMQAMITGTANRVIVVSHGGPHMWLVSEYLGLPLDRQRLPALSPAHFTVLQYNRDGTFSGIRGMNLSAWDETVL